MASPSSVPFEMKAGELSELLVSMAGQNWTSIETVCKSGTNEKFHFKSFQNNESVKQIRYNWHLLRGVSKDGRIGTIWTVLSPEVLIIPRSNWVSS